MVIAVRPLVVSLLLVALSCAGGCGGPSETPDAGATDAAGDGNVDTGATCTDDASCDDGLFCNGTERCAAGRCAAGTVPDCADAIACTRDQCSEDRRACLHAVPDLDGDGHGDATCVDGAGVALGDDCDDDDDTAYFGAVETCDAAGHDEDCDPTTHGRIDADSDGFEDARCCNGTSCGDDCNDGARSASPDGTEVCNGIDDDCDTRIDEMVSVAGFVDDDRDGFGDDTRPMTSCGDTAGFSTRPGDCDDTSIEINRGQLELCDTEDNDCDGAVDEMISDVTWYVDADGDGYGTSTSTMVACARPSGHSILGTDCDDGTSSRSPRAAEVCNAIDDDCNGRADYAITAGDLEDDDGDHVADEGCGLPRGLDCDDYSASVQPSASEVCNGLDDDCDARTDESATSATFHRDADGDGYGDRGTAVIGCFAPSGYVVDATDCDDALATRHPGALEACDAIDGDCDRRIDETPAGSSCTIPNAISSCTVGICVMESCAEGYGDCSLAPGCETPTVTDPLHCGGCSPCSSGDACLNGLCYPNDAGNVGLFGATGDDAVTAVGFGLEGMFAVAGRYRGAYRGACGALADASGTDAFVEFHDIGGGCARAIGLAGVGEEEITDLQVDDVGNVYVTLSTTSSTLSVSSGGTIPSGAGQAGRDGVIVSLGPSGVLRWSYRLGGGGDDRANGLVLAGSSVFVACGVTAPVTLDGTRSFPAGDGTLDACIVRLDASTGAVAGGVVATPSGTGAGADESLAIDVDDVSGDLIAVGYASVPTRFGGTPGTVTPSGASDGFVWRATASTLASAWALGLGGPNTDVATSVGVGGGDAFVGGHYVGAASFGTSMLTATGGPADRDGFLFGIDLATRASIFGTCFGGPGPDAVASVAARSDGVFVVGTIAPGYTNVGGLLTEGMGGDDGYVVSVDSVMGLAYRGHVFQGSSDSSALAIACNGGQTIAGGTFDGPVRIHGSTLPDVGGGSDGLWVIDSDSLK